jgi:hypothetical protein
LFYVVATHGDLRMTDFGRSLEERELVSGGPPLFLSVAFPFVVGSHTTFPGFGF